MTNTNRELVRLMEDLHLSRAEVARHLDVPLVSVDHWTTTDGNKDQEMMPESDLLLLKYALMSENRRSQLF